MSEEKFSKCGKEKNVSVEFRVFGKNERNVLEKNQSVLGENLKWKILLSSCSLVGLYVDWKVQSYGLIGKLK